MRTGTPAVLADDLGHRVRGDQVVDHRGCPAPCASSRVATSAVIALGDTGRAGRVDDEAAVGVAVEGQPDVGALGDDRALQVDEVRRLERVGLVVGERAVELEVQRHDRQRQRGQDGVAEHGGHGVAAHPVAGVDDDLQRADAGQVDQPAQVARRRRRAGRPARRRRARAAAGRPVSRYSPGAVADLGQPGVLPDRHGVRAAHLDAVVLRRVVAGGEHRARAGRGGRRRSRACRWSRARPRRTDAPRCSAPSAKARARPGPDSRMSWAVTMLVGAGDVDERGADGPRDRLVELVGDDAAHVVGLDQRREVHDRRAYRRAGRAARSVRRAAPTRRWPRRPVSRAVGPPARALARPRAASRTASASASRSSACGIGAGNSPTCRSDLPAARTVSRTACSSHRS